LYAEIAKAIVDEHKMPREYARAIGITATLPNLSASAASIALKNHLKECPHAALYVCEDPIESWLPSTHTPWKSVLQQTIHQFLSNAEYAFRDINKDAPKSLIEDPPAVPSFTLFLPEKCMLKIANARLAVEVATTTSDLMKKLALRGSHSGLIVVFPLDAIEQKEFNSFCDLLNKRTDAVYTAVVSVAATAFGPRLESLIAQWKRFENDFARKQNWIHRSVTEATDEGVAWTFSIQRDQSNSWTAVSVLAFLKASFSQIDWIIPIPEPTASYGHTRDSNVSCHSGKEDDLHTSRHQPNQKNLSHYNYHNRQSSRPTFHRDRKRHYDQSPRVDDKQKKGM
jgi:hypothetical protein